MLESNFVRHAALFVLLLLLDDTSAQLCSGYKGEDDGKLQSNRISLLSVIEGISRLISDSGWRVRPLPAQIASASLRAG